jgi:hypothetical protein
MRNESAIDGQWKLGGKRQAIYGRTDLSVRDRSEAAAKMTASR